MTNFLRIEKGVYRHTKSGKQYEVIGVALQTETDEPLVIYRPLYECEFELFARPYTMFIETTSINGIQRRRFQRVEDGEIGDELLR